MKPYYDDGTVTLWHGDCREILPELAVTADLAVGSGDRSMTTQAETRSCSNCGAESTHLRRGWCRGCYLRWFKAGKPESGPPPLQNTSLEKWLDTPVHPSGRKPTDLEVGTAGEHIVCADLLLAGYTAFRTDQTCAYDVAVDLDGRLVRIQVKSTRGPRPIPQREQPVLAYQFHVRRAGKGGKRMYRPGEFDLLALVGLDLRQVAYVAPSMTRTLVQIRQPGAGGKQFADFPFGRALADVEVPR